jgi:hypothetical protein
MKLFLRLRMREISRCFHRVQIPTQRCIGQDDRISDQNSRRGHERNLEFRPADCGTDFIALCQDPRRPAKLLGTP